MAVDPDIQNDADPVLNVSLINSWIEDEGYDNKELSEKLGISIRAVSSMRNNGTYHGKNAVAKLANLMGRDVAVLFLT
jgi:hypothetical protein